MPRFFKQNLLFKNKEEENFLPNPLDTPELPKDEASSFSKAPEDKQAETWQNQIFPQPAMEVYHAEDSSDFPQPANPQFQDVFEPEMSFDNSSAEPVSEPVPLEHTRAEPSTHEEPHHHGHEESHKEAHKEHQLPYHEHSEKQPSSHVHRDYDPDLDEPDPVKTLLTWIAPSRPFRKKDRSFYTAIITMIVLISLIALLAGQVMLIGVLLAFLFLIYALNFVPPEDVTYKISTQGVTISDHFYHWQELDSFWFTEKDKYKLLHILTRIRFPGVLIMVLGEADQEEVKRLAARYLPYHEIAPKSLMDKWADGLQKHFPLENPHRV
jgi:hypothetical protein